MAARWLVLLGLAGCIEPTLVHCEDGRACAAGLVCDVVHATCVTPSQLAICEGQPNATPCISDVLEGVCIDGVCLAAGCGNGALEPDEICDDGNAEAGDGCAADCSSDESCTNGFLDPGEACDDGNLVSHDGCSSQCVVESITWSTIPIRIVSDQPTVTAFDLARRRLVVAAGRATWEWDGTAWRIAGTSSPGVTWDALAYDSVRQRVVGFYTLGNRVGVADWDGSAWATLPVDAAPLGRMRLAVYDSMRQRFVVIARTNANVRTFTPATLSWGQLPNLPYDPTGKTVGAYDPMLDQVILLDPASPGNTTVLHQPPLAMPSWQPYTAGGTHASNGWAMTYDPDLMGVISAGGQLIQGTTSYPSTVRKWDGNSWVVPITNGPSLGRDAAAWYDPLDKSLNFFGGYKTEASDQIIKLVDNTITQHAPLSPPIVGTVLHDTRRDELVAIADFDSVWAYNGTWRRLVEPATALVLSRSYVWDPVRESIIGINYQSGDTWAFRDSWTLISNTLNAGLSTLAYDYANHRVVGIDTSGTFALPSNTNDWALFGDPFAASSAAYDPETQSIAVLSTDVMTSGVHDLVGVTWKQSLGPGLGYQLVTAFERGSLLMSPTHDQSEPPKPVWERRDDAFTLSGVQPIARALSPPAFTWTHGRIVMPVTEDNGTFLLVRQLGSATPDESCVTSEDADADGAAGCSDPDCWRTCFPACPLATQSCI